MEEIDGIIIESLKNLNCNIPEDVTNLKQFDPDLIVSAIAHCLETMLPGSSFPRKLPPSMSLRLKVATQLAEQIKELGFRGDMGYQSILYTNEIEIRRVLMFLVERLPREANKSVTVEEIGFLPRLVKQIEKRVKVALQKPWVPTGALFYGARDCGEFYLPQSFGNCTPLRTENLTIPRSQEDSTDYLREYWARNLPDVTKQCHKNNLIATLLFKDSEFSKNNLFEPKVTTTKSVSCIIEASSENVGTHKISAVQALEGTEEKHSKTDELLTEIQTEKDKIIAFQEEINFAVTRLKELNTVKVVEEEKLKDIENKINIKTKTLTVLSKEENMAKLRGMIEKGKQRLVDLAEEWEKVQKPLLEEYDLVKNNLAVQENRVKEELQKRHTLQEQNKQLIADLKEKEQLEQNLIKKCESLNKNTSRSAYTRRILEIIGNIKKQNDEIQNILKDTKEVQKEINSLNGQVDRSFTLSDELIFRDARRDETARKAYKLLAALHSECGEIIKAVTELGLLERESRNLQEQVDAEMAKETAVKLDRVAADLEQVKKETASLLKQQTQK